MATTPPPHTHTYVLWPLPLLSCDSVVVWSAEELEYELTDERKALLALADGDDESSDDEAIESDDDEPDSTADHGPANTHELVTLTRFMCGPTDGEIGSGRPHSSGRVRLDVPIGEWTMCAVAKGCIGSPWSRSHPACVCVRDGVVLSLSTTKSMHSMLRGGGAMSQTVIVWCMHGVTHWVWL